MKPIDHLERDVAPVKHEAIDWAARLAIGPVSDTEWHAFDRWRRSSPAHADAFRTASDFMDELRALPLPAPIEESATVVPLRPATARVSRRAFLGGSAVAASMAAGIVATQSPLGLWPSLAEMLADTRTAAGERTRFSPVAGVDVELSSRSSVSRIAQGLSLVAGEIFVAIAQRSAPFRIEAGGIRVLASKAHFDVRAFDGELCVTCVEGHVQAQQGLGDTITLDRGQAATYAADGSLTQSRVDPGIATAWRRGMLIFDGTPLVRAVAQINRFYPGRLVVRGKALRTRLITGVFHVNQIELAAPQIRSLTGAALTSLPGGVVVLR
jgi:transmembrane sensor